MSDLNDLNTQRSEQINQGANGQVIYAGLALLEDRIGRDFALYVEDGMILATGTRARMTAQYPAAALVGGDALLMLPGFVNAHDHGRAIGTQSLGVPDSFLEVWLNSLGSLPTLPPYLAAAWEGLQLIKSGVTSTAHSHNPLTWETQFEEIPQALRGYAAAGVRVAMHPVIIDQNRLVYAQADQFIARLPPRLQAQIKPALAALPLTTEDYFTGLEALYAAHHDPYTHKVHIQASPAGGQWCSDALIMRAVDWARAHHSRVQMHLLETRYQQQYAHQTWGKGFVAHLDALDALGDWLTLAHMVWVEDDDPPLLAEKGVGIAHNPSSNLRLRSGIAPFAKFKNAGIGMDGHTLDDDQDYLRELRLAWTLANQPRAGSADASAWAIVRAGTRQGAALTLGTEVPLGALKAGHLADLVLLDWEAIRGPWSPDDHPDEAALPAFFLRRAHRGHIRHVMAQGEWVLKEGLHTRLDETALAAEIKAVLTGQRHTRQNDDLGAYIRRFYAGWDAKGLPLV